MCGVNAILRPVPNPRVELRGVNFDGDIRTEAYGRLITVTDPDGNQFDLFEPADE